MKIISSLGCAFQGLVLLLVFGSYKLHVQADEAAIAPKGLISVRRFVEPLEGEDSQCTFAGTIVLGQSSSLEVGDKFFNVAKKQLTSIALMVDHINQYHCGVRLSSGNYSIELRTYDDQSSTDRTRAIAEKLASSSDVNVLLGGYSSGLTGPLAEVADDNNLLLLAPGSASISVFADRGSVFGTLPPTAKYTAQAVKGLALIGAKTIATVWEDASFTRGACGVIPDLAAEYGLEVTSTQEVISAPNETAFEPVAEKLAGEDPDVVVTCVYDAGCLSWMHAMRAVN
jgi:branched-chain amino acid transport system substrate-binding protein